MDRPDEDERPILSDWRKTGDGEWARQRDDVGTGPVWIRRVPHGYQWCVVWLGCSVAGGSQPIPPYGDGPAIMAAREAADAAALHWYRLTDEGPARDLARAADFPTLMRALSRALNPGPSEAHVMRRQAHAAGTVPPDPECICGAPWPCAKAAPRRCETCGSPDVRPVGQAKCAKCIDGKARDYDAQSRAMLLAAIDQYAALLRDLDTLRADLAESQRANREAAEVLREVGTERALEAAEKCEANS